MSILMIGTLPKGSTHMALHKHTFYELLLVTEGEGTITAGDKEYPFHAGSIVVVPPGVVHGGRSDGEYMEMFIQTDRPIPPGAGNAKHEAIFLEDDEKNAVSLLMQMMLYRYIQGDKNNSTLSLMFDLVIQLISEKCVDMQRDPVVEDVRRLLVLHYNDPQLSLSELLGSTGYNRDYIRRRFIEACGVTPSEYLTSLRIEHAKRLLRRKTELQFSVADIGEMCGYYDQRYFSRVFKKQVGIPPEAFALLPAE